MKFLIILCVLCTASESWARTLWSGSFVGLNIAGSSIRVSANYPERGPGKICGIELKSQTMILNRSVWERVADGLLVRSESERGVATVPPFVEVAEGPRLSYLFQDLTASYATLTLATKTGEGLKEYLSQAISGGEHEEPVIAVARECL